jgi:hypothetical protein
MFIADGRQSPMIDKPAYPASRRELDGFEAPSGAAQDDQKSGSSL